MTRPDNETRERELAEKAVRHGRRTTADGDVFQVPSWDDVTWLLAELAAARQETETVRAAVKAECDADLNCGVDCDCEDYDGEWSYCLAHRILAALAAVAEDEPQGETHAGVREHG